MPETMECVNVPDCNHCRPCAEGYVLRGTWRSLSPWCRSGRAQSHTVRNFEDDFRSHTARRVYKKFSHSSTTCRWHTTPSWRPTTWSLSFRFGLEPSPPFSRGFLSVCCSQISWSLPKGQVHKDPQRQVSPRHNDHGHAGVRLSLVFRRLRTSHAETEHT